MPQSEMYRTAHTTRPGHTLLKKKFSTILIVRFRIEPARHSARLRRNVVKLLRFSCFGAAKTGNRRNVPKLGQQEKTFRAFSVSSRKRLPVSIVCRNSGSCCRLAPVVEEWDAREDDEQAERRPNRAHHPQVNGQRECGR